MVISSFLKDFCEQLVLMSRDLLAVSTIKSNKKGGGKALTMTMTPWNLTHGQWSKYLTMASDILESAPWSKWLLCGQTSRLDQRSTILTIENLYLTRHKYEARNRDDRNFGGPKIWRNLAKTVTFRTSQKIKEFSSV